MTARSTVSPATKTETSANEIWVYGSVARGTHSPYSDLDVLVVADAAPDPSLVESSVAALPQLRHLSVRRYSWREVEEMAGYGSLFLLHLKLEGQLLHASEPTNGLTDLLTRLPPYRNGVRDIRGFSQALDDARWGLGDSLHEDDFLFELGTIATVIRHCSILACYKLGTPRFQLADSIGLSFDAAGMSEFTVAAIELYRFRLATARQIPAPIRPSLGLANLWLSRAQTFVERVGNL